MNLQHVTVSYHFSVVVLLVQHTTLEKHLLHIRCGPLSTHQLHFQIQNFAVLRYVSLSLQHSSVVATSHAQYTIVTMLLPLPPAFPKHPSHPNASLATRKQSQNLQALGKMHVMPILPTLV